MVFSLIILGLLRWLLGQAFAEESNWESVATNLRLLMAYNYPTGQFVRIWVSAGALFFAVGLSFATWNVRPMIGFRRLLTTLSGLVALR